jgi:hypothetical protein
MVESISLDELDQPTIQNSMKGRPLDLSSAYEQGVLGRVVGRPQLASAAASCRSTDGS